MANVVHSTLTGTDLHEPKGIASANSGELYFANGAGSGAWAAPAEVVFMNKHIAGLVPQNASGDPTNDITITAGTARDSTNTEDMILTASITKRLDAAWVVGDAQGGLDAGSIANTVYHIWLIKRTDTGVVDALFSTSASSPTMPTNYTKKRRIGSFVRVSASIQTFTATEINGGGLNVTISPVSAGSLTFATTGTNNTLSNFPTGIRFEAIASFHDPSAGGVSVIVVSPDVTLSSLAGSSMSMGSTVSGGKTCGFVRAVTNTSAQLKCASADAGINYSLVNHGWQDFRRD